MRTRAHQLTGILAALAVAAGTSTCGDSTGTAAIDHVTVIGRASLRVGETVAFIARAFDAHDNALSVQHKTWATSDAAVATVSTSGLVTTLGPGQTTISATADGVTGSLPVTVTLRPVSGIRVLPPVDSLFPGDSLLLSAVLLDSAGTPLTDRSGQWRSSDTAKATVSGGGMLHARSVGGVAITFATEGQVGGAFVAVQYPAVSLRLPDSLTMTTEQLVQIIPDLRSASGVHVAGRAILWSSADTSVVRVTTLGVVTPRAPGTTVVSAACCAGLRDSTAVRVIGSPPVRIDFYASPSTLFVDSVMLVQAQETDRFGRFTDRPVSWSVSDSTIAQLSVDSLDSRRARLRGLRFGSVVLRAVADTAHAAATVTVDLPIVRLALEPDTVRLRVGETSPIHQTLQDAGGNVRADPADAVFRVADTTIVALIDGILGRRVGQTTVIGEVGVPIMFVDTMVVVVSPDSGTRLDWSTPATFADRDVPLTVSISLTDSARVPLATGQDVRLQSADSGIVSITPTFLPGLSGTASVTLHPHRGGAVTITARTDSLASPLWVRVVDYSPIATLSFTAPLVLQDGDSVPLAVTRLDVNGTPRPYVLTWSSTDSSVAIVTDSSILVGRGPGRARVMLQSGALRDTATVTVRSTAGPSIASVAPSVLLADSIVTITGANFDANPANDTVEVAGVPATVLAASATELTVRLAGPERYPCAATHTAEVAVATPGGLGAVTAAFAAARQLSLLSGEATPLLDVAFGGCTELSQAGGAYEIAVVDASPNAQTTVAYELHLAGATAVSAVSSQQARGISDGPDVYLPDPAAARENLRLHLRILEESRQLAQRVGAPAPLLRARFFPPRSIADSVGSLVRFRMPDVDRPDFCSSYRGVTARRAYVGAHLDIYEDTGGVVAGTMDTAIAQLGREFDATMYPILVANFGDPLALDSLLDRNGKIVLLLSTVVNPLAAGFVVSCDFYPESVAPSSNTGEIIYAFAPTSLSSSFETGSVSYWRWLIRTVLMHESKHVAAFAQRLSLGAPLEAPWLEEGSAVIGEEIWSRSIYGTAWKGEAGYAQTLYCDVRPTLGQCAGRPYAMFNAFALLHDFADGYAAPPGNEVHTPLGPADPSDGSFYGSAWSLLRWSIDQYASSESAFLKALVQDPALTGVANLEARTGRRYPSLVADWLLASQLDGVSAPAPQFGIPSWNTRDIFAGMNTDFPSSFPRPFPYRARTVAFGDVTIPVPVLRGGTGSVFRIEGAQSAKQLIELRGTGGSPLPPVLGIEILRVQ